MLNFFKSQSDSNENLSKMSLLSTHINESQNDGKEERKTFLDNEKGNTDDMNDKNEILKKDYKEDEMILQQRIKCRKRSLLICLILTIIAISALVVVFLYK